MNDKQEYSRLVALARSLSGLREELKTAREQLKLLEAKEADVINELLLSMQTVNMKSVNLEGIGQLTVKRRRLPKIQDIELLTRAMLAKIVEAGKAGRPLSDGLLLQQRLHQSNFETYFSEADPATVGVAVVEKSDITFTPAKEAK